MSRSGCSRRTRTERSCSSAGQVYPIRRSCRASRASPKSCFENAGEIPDDFRAVALKGSLFDTAIGLLENRIAGGRKAVRRHLETILLPDLGQARATRTHSALLTLGKCRSGQHRIVTTNFERLFESVIAEQRPEVATYNAPLLPVPKNRWNGLVYLHGLLPEKSTEEEANRLVLTSGDFGLAYLIERWAARFVHCLLRGVPAA